MVEQTLGRSSLSRRRAPPGGRAWRDDEPHRVVELVETTSPTGWSSLSRRRAPPGGRACRDDEPQPGGRACRAAGPQPGGRACRAHDPHRVVELVETTSPTGWSSLSRPRAPPGGRACRDHEPHRVAELVETTLSTDRPHHLPAVRGTPEARTMPYTYI